MRAIAISKALNLSDITRTVIKYDYYPQKVELIINPQNNIEFFEVLSNNNVLIFTKNEDTSILSFYSNNLLLSTL